MIDLQSTRISTAEQKLLAHPQVGGVILFSRNYQSRSQLCQLVKDIHACRTPPLLIAVDHEGGRVQRFREGFTILPPAGHYGMLFNRDSKAGLNAAELGGWLMASELRCCGIDISFAPVLDLDRGISQIIGDRAFHHDPQIATELARAFMRGMQQAGMQAVGKHYPGHGGVAPDSHLALPVDERSFADIEAEDLLPFERMTHYGMAAIMPAHVVYSQVDSKPAGFSKVWLKQILRERLGFEGAIFSDDMSMKGAAEIGDFTQRTLVALDAGCDMILICNTPEVLPEVLRALQDYSQPVSQARLVRMHGKHDIEYDALVKQSRWQDAIQMVSDLDHNPELALGDDMKA